MTIRFTCDNPECGKSISAPDELGGKKARCPHCGKVLLIPKPDEGIIALADEDEPAGKKTAHPEAGGAVSEGPAGRTNTCAICGTTYPVGSRCPRCRPVQPQAAYGGFNLQKWLTVGIIVAVFGGLIVGAWYLIKLYTQTGTQYATALKDACERAADTACMVNLNSIWRSIQAEATMNDGKLPESLDNLYSPSQLRCPAGDKEFYTYIPGQNLSMPLSNVLIYETAGTHRGKCNVLLLSGSVVEMTPEQVKSAVAGTKAVIAAKKK